MIEFIGLMYKFVAQVGQNFQSIGQRTGDDLLVCDNTQQFMVSLCPP